MLPLFHIFNLWATNKNKNKYSLLKLIEIDQEVSEKSRKQQAVFLLMHDLLMI